MKRLLIMSDPGAALSHSGAVLSHPGAALSPSGIPVQLCYDTRGQMGVLSMGEMQSDPPPQEDVTAEFSHTGIEPTHFATDRLDESTSLNQDERLNLARATFLRRGYEIIEELGRGGMGVVYKARDTRLKRLVALKMILAGEHADQKALDRFRAEAEVLARVDHPGIVQVYEVGELNGHPFLVLEFVEGGSLTDFTGRKPVDPVFSARIVEAIARAVQAAHDQGIAHRDLKPDNILMLRRLVSSEDTLDDVSGMISTATSMTNVTPGAPTEPSVEHVTPKVADFGLAKQVDVADGMTRTGAILGSPNYMAPEQASGDVHEVGFAADVYALGAILYYLLTGRPPFLGTTAAETILMVRDDEPVAPTQLQPRLSKDIETICLKCLEKDPKKRFATARDLRDELGRFVRGEPIRSRPLTPVVRAWRWCRRNAVLATSLSAVGLSLAAVFVIAITAAIWMANLAERERETRRTAEKQLVQLHTTNGLRLIDQGFLPSSLPWFAEAVRLLEQQDMDDDQIDQSYIARLRLAATLRQCPKYSQLWFEENFVHHNDFVADEQFVIVSGQSGWVRLFDTETGELAGPPLKHAQNVYFSTLSPNGQQIATCCNDGVLRFWDRETGEITFDSMRHDEPVFHASFDPSGGRIVSAGRDGFARVWDAASGKPLWQLEHDGSVWRARFDSKGKTILTASADGTARLWDAETGNEIRRLPHNGDVLDAVWSPDERHIATASRDRTGRVWDLEGNPVTPSLEHQAVLTGIAFSHDGRRVVTSSEDQTARVWDAATGLPLTLPLVHEAYVSQASFSPDDRLVLTSSDDSTARIWNSRTGKQVGLPLEHFDLVYGAKFASNGRQILTRATRNSMIWDLSSSEQSTRQFRHEGLISAATFSPDGSCIAIGDYSRTARIWNVANGKPLTRPLEHRFNVLSVCFSPDGKLLYSIASGGSPDQSPRGEFRVWDATTGETLYVKWLEQPVDALSASNAYVAISTNDTAVVLETSNWQSVLEVKHQGAIFGLDFHPTEHRLAIGSYDHNAQIWDLTTKTASTPLLQHAGRVDHVEFSSDGKWLLTTCSGEGKPSYSRIWDAETGQEIVSHDEPDTFYCLHATFSPSLQRVVTSLSDSAVISDSSTGLKTAASMRHDGMVQKARFSPDGRLVATASWDRTARVWDAQTGQPVSPPLVHGEWVIDVHFSPDGNKLLTVSKDRAAMLWDIRGTQLDSQELRVVSELLSQQRASVVGITTDVGITDLRNLWQHLRSSNSPLIKIDQSQIVTWHRNQFKDAFTEKDWNAALFHSNEILQIEPNQFDVWIDRGLTYSEMGRWSDAADAFSRADDENVSDEFLCHYAFVALASNNIDAYATLCERLSEKLSQTLSDDFVRRILSTCSLDARSGIAWDQILNEATELAEDDRNSPQLELVIALVLYRAGQVQESLNRLTGIKEVIVGRQPAFSVKDALVRDILMVILQPPTDSAEAVSRLEQIRQEVTRASSNQSWDQRLYVSLLLNEAAQKIEDEAR